MCRASRGTLLLKTADLAKRKRGVGKMNFCQTAVLRAAEKIGGGAVQFFLIIIKKLIIFR